MTKRPSVLLTVLLLMGTRWTVGQAPCVPPEAMKAQLQGKPDAGAYKDLGVWYAGQKQYACAADAFATSLQMDPNQKDVAHVVFMFGASLDLSGETKEAIGALQEAAQLGYNDINLHIMLAEAFDATHAAKEAEEQWHAALGFEPESSTVLDALSNDLVRDNDFNATIALLENPRLAGQRTPQQSLNLAAAYTATAKTSEAARVLRDGLNTSPDSAALGNQLAKTLVELHRQDEAMAVLEVEIEDHPADADTAIDYLETAMAAEPERAQKAAGRFLAAFPHNAKLLYLSGVLEMNGGNLTQARSDLEQSLAIKPDEALPHEALGDLLAQLKELPGARENFERAIALGDSNPEVKANLAKVLAALGSGK